MAMTDGTAKLVKTGYCNGDTSKPIKLYVYYKTSQSVATNKSTITVGMYVTTPSGWNIGSWEDFNGSYVGTTSLTFNGTIPNFSGTRWLVENKQFTVDHNSDGTGKATIAWKWGVNSPWGKMQNPSGSFQITLPTIARKTTVSCPESGTMKGNVVISLDRKSTTAFTHTLKYTFGGTTETIKSGVNADTYTWAVPDLAAKCNNAKSGTCTITCETYNASTLVGTTTDTMTLNVPAATTPTFSASTAKMGSSLTINTPRNSSNFTHTLSFSFGGFGGTIATDVATSKAWTPGDLAKYCDNATKGTCTITCKTYNGTALVGTTTKDIPLHVYDASATSLSPSTVAMDSYVKIHIGSRSRNFIHTVSYSFNGATGTVGTDVIDMVSWKPPLDLAKKIPSDTSGKGTITCKTYNGTALVGTTTAEFAATVPNTTATQPSVTAFNLTPAGDIPSAFDGLFIQGKTGVKASYTAASAYSSIASYKMTVDGKAYGGNPATSGLFSTSGSKTVKGVVTDARGYYTEKTDSITVIPYSKPRIVPYSGERAIVCERCTSDGALSDSGMFLKIKIGRSYHKVMDGETQKNFCTVGYRYKASAATAYSSDLILIKPSDTFDEVNTEPIPGVVESLTTSFDVQIFIIDTMGESDVYTVRIPTAGTDFHLREGGGGAAFGKYAEIPNGVEFEWNVYGRAYGLGRLISIPSGVDLNDEKYRQFGCYAVFEDATANNIQNIPYKAAGILRVYSAQGGGAVDGDWVYIAQEYTPYHVSTSGFYRRLIQKNGDAGWSQTPWVLYNPEVAGGEYTTSTDVTWRYKKWADGTAECWAKRNVVVDATSQWGSLYYASISAAALPFTFVDPPVCNISVERGSSTSETTFFVAFNGRTTTTATSTVMLCRPTTVTGADMNVLYHVKGRWK